MAMGSLSWVTLLAASSAALLLSLLTSQQNPQGKWQWQAPRALLALADSSKDFVPPAGEGDGGRPLDSSSGGLGSGSAGGARGDDVSSALAQRQGWSAGFGSGNGEKSLAEDAGGPLDLKTARLLVDEIKEAAEAAAGAAAAVEAVHKDVLAHKQDCEAQSRAVGEELGVSFAQLQDLALSVGKASDALSEMRFTEFAKFLEALAEAKQSQDWVAIAQRQDVLSSLATSLKRGQEEAARDLQMLKSSYLSLEGNIQEQLRRVTDSTAEASANNYRLLAERLREVAEARLAELQRAHNDHRLDELAADRSIQDMIQQLKRKGVAVIDVSDVFPNRSFDTVRKELMVRVAKRVKAFFLPVFIVTQTQEEFSDWLYSRYHLVPSMRMLENIIEELSFINDRETYAVVRVESVLTDVIIRKADHQIEVGATEGSGQSAFAGGLHKSKDRHKLQVGSLTEGRVLSYISQPSQESLVVARGPFFGAEVVKRFDQLTKSHLRKMVGGHLDGRAVLVVYMGDRKGEIARPTPSPQEVVRKLDMAEKLCTSYSAPSQEVAALWRQMEMEIPFYSIFFRVIVAHLRCALQGSCRIRYYSRLSFLRAGQVTSVAPLAIIQIQALVKKEWHIPSSRALQSVVSYVNGHPARGGVQAIVTVVEEKETGFWRSTTRHTVKVTMRSADAPPMRLRLALAQTSTKPAAPGEAKVDVPVVSLAGEVAVQQYLTQSLAKVIVPSIGGRASFRRLLLHVCISGRTCQDIFV